MRQYLIQIYFKHNREWRPLKIGKSNRRKIFDNNASAHRAISRLREKENRPTRVFLIGGAEKEKRALLTMLQHI